MRILFTRFPYESARGGAEHQTEWLASCLLERGHALHFLGQCHHLSAMLTKIGVDTQHLRIGLPPVTLWLAMSFLWRKNAMKKKLIAAIKALPRKPDVIVMLSLSEKILLTEWASENGMNVVWVEHDRIGRWLTKNPWLGALKKASEHATIVCVSELSKQKMIRIGFDEKRVIAIPNGIPSAPPMLPKTPACGQEVNVGVIARLSKEKGIDVLIRALQNLPDIHLTIVGIGSEEGYLRSLIFEDAQRIGVERIKLYSHVTDLEKLYRSLDVFVLPSSDHDPFGLVAAEAMARGVATVVTDACGIAQYLEHGKDVLIVRAGSVEQLESALRTLLDPVVRSTLATEGIRTVKTHFSVAVMTHAYEQIMKKSG